MRILHIVTTADLGGAENHLLMQVREQTRRGHAVRVAYLKGHGTLADDFRRAGAEEVARVGTGPAAPLRLAPRVRWADVVHSHLLKADALAAVVATLAGRRSRLVSGKHNDEHQLRDRRVALAHGLLGRLPARTIVLSDHVGRYMVEVGRLRPGPIRRVYYGIDPAPFDDARAREAEVRPRLRGSFGFGDGDVVFLCVGRFHAAKAHPVLLRAFRRALDARPSEAPPFRLLLAGDDPYGDGRERAEALARELELGDAARFAGLRRDVPELLAASDVLVQAALWEGLGLVYLEAMCASRPVLASRVSAIPEVVVDGETGILVTPGDPEALAGGMVRLGTDPELRRRMGEAGRRRIPEVFGIERMAEETLAVYRELAGAAS